jgi:hypothetical protein
VTLSYIDRRVTRRVLIVIVVLVCGTALLSTGYDPITVLPMLLGLGLVGAAVAGWVVDGAPAVSVSSALEAGGRA